MNNLLTPADLAARYAVTKSTVLDWFHAAAKPAKGPVMLPVL